MIPMQERPFRMRRVSFFSPRKARVSSSDLSGRRADLWETRLPKKVTRYPKRVTPYPRRDTLDPKKETLDPRRETRFPKKVTRYPNRVTRYPRRDRQYPSRETLYPNRDARDPSWETRYLPQMARLDQIQEVATKGSKGAETKPIGCLFPLGSIPRSLLRLGWRRDYQSRGLRSRDACLAGLIAPPPFSECPGACPGDLY
jgi:hypothetical protein